MTIRAPFQPQRGANQSATTAGASASITLDAQAKSVRIVNSGVTNGCHIRIGKGAQTAAATDMFVRANSEIIVQKGDGDDTLAHIQNTGTTTIFVQTGEGGQ